ncbi:MAG: single-stranded DNA-binding protein [Ginsengibacter sp.]
MNTFKNSVQLLGNLGNAPEIKSTETGKKFARFSIATNEGYKNAKGEWVENTQWHNLIAWGPVAENVEKYLSKGTEVLIDGKLVTGNYQDKEGNKKYFTDVQVNEFLIVAKKATV